MRSDPVTVSGEGIGITDALALTEKTAAENGLEKKESLHLRLLAEEMFGLVRAVAGGVAATYWIENVDKSFELHITSIIDSEDAMALRDQVKSIAAEKAKGSAKGFMGKIRAMIVDMLSSAKESMPYAMMNTVSAYPLGGTADMVKVWSMDVYKDELKRRIDDEDAVEAWDELEKSIVAKIADNIKVRIVSNNVDITVYKNFR